MLRQRFCNAIRSCLIVAAPCVMSVQVRAQETGNTPVVDVKADTDSDSVTERMVDQLQAKKWLTNADGRCVACHFKVPAKHDGEWQKVFATDQQGHFTDLSADYLLLGLSNTWQGQSCIKCHDQIHEATGPCARADRCTRHAEAKHKVTYLGVGLEPVPTAVREHVKLPEGVGLMIETVEPDSPAARADLRRYDILEKLDGQLLINQDQFAVLVRTYPPEHEVSLELIRANERKTLAAKLGQRDVTGPQQYSVADLVMPAGQGDFVNVGAPDTAYTQALAFIHRSQTAPDQAASPQQPARVTYLGISTSPPPAALVKQLKLPAGRCLIIDSVEADSPAAAAGLKTFDVLDKLDDQFIVNSEQLTVLVRLRQAGDEVTLTLIREGKPILVKVKLGEHAVASQESAPGAAWADLDADGDLDIVSLTHGGKHVLLADFDQANEKLSGVLTSTAESNELSDQEYIRRVYLDLTGTLPSAKDVAEFSADDRPDKRKRLVNRLLSRPEVVSALGDKAVLQWSDDEQSLTLTTADSGQKRLTAKDRYGKVLFEGPVDTDEQRRTLDPRLAMKVALMLKGFGGSPATEPPDANALLEKVLPRFSTSGSSLKQAIDELRQATGANIAVDWKSLARSGVSPDEPLEVELHDVRLRTVIKTLLTLASSEQARLRYTIEDGVMVIAAEAAE